MLEFSEDGMPLWLTGTLNEHGLSPPYKGKMDQQNPINDTYKH